MALKVEATVNVAVASPSRGLVRFVRDSLASDNSTACAVYQATQLEACAGTHVLVIDDSPNALRRVSHNAVTGPLRRQTVYVNAIDEARVAWLMDKGADEAVVTASPALGARLRAAAHRARESLIGHVICVGDIVLERDSRRAWCAEKEIHLTPHEFCVLHFLLRHALMLVNTDSLIEHVWRDVDKRKTKATAQVYVSYLRQKLASSRMLTLKHLRGCGYHFEQKASLVTGVRKASA